MFRSLTYLNAVALVALIPLAAGCDGSDRPRTTSAGVSAPEVTETAVTGSETTGMAPLVAAPVSYEAAESAFGAGRYTEATELFTAYTASRPENPWGYYMLGMSAWRAGEPEKASSAFDRGLELDPAHRKSLFNSSRVLLETGHPKEALERIEKALSLDPLSNEGLRLLGRARYELGDVDEAIKAYQRALTIDERDVWSMNNLGLIYIQQDRSCEALPPLARAVELRSNAPVFQNNLGTALERSGYPTAAARAYEAAIAADSGYTKASVALARVTGGGQEPEPVPVDLPRLSQSFQEAIESWRAPAEAADSTAVPAQTVKDSSVDAGVSGGKLDQVVEPCASEI